MHKLNIGMTIFLNKNVYAIAHVTTQKTTLWCVVLFLKYRLHNHGEACSAS